jgi:hypothetical protein
MIYSSWGACKHYHSDSFQRAKILLMALTARKSGGGLRVASWWPVEGFDKLSGGRDVCPLRMQMRAAWRMISGGFGARHGEPDRRGLAYARRRARCCLYAHAGYLRSGQAEWNDLHCRARPRPT